MPPVRWNAVRRILAVRLDNIGDVVMLGPALRAIKKTIPASRITLMASPAGSQTAPLLPWIDDVIVHRAVWQDVSRSMPLDPGRELATADMLRAAAFDAAIIFTNYRQSPYPPASICYLAGIPVRLGQSREFGGAILSHYVEPLPDHVHQVDRNLHLLESEHFSLAGRHLELSLPPDTATDAGRLLEGAGIRDGEPFVVLAPGASCAARRYPIERYAAAAERIHAHTSLRFVIVGDQRESGFAERLRQLRPGAVVSLIGRTSIPMLAAIIRLSRLVMTNNSAAMHIADAQQTPMIVFFSGSDMESQWRPRTGTARVLTRPVPCTPCHRFTCPSSLECLDIPPQDAAEEAVRLLTDRGRRRHNEDAPVPYAKAGVYQ